MPILLTAFAFAAAHQAGAAEFVDMSGHGYGIVRASTNLFDVSFVCIPRPIEDVPSADGGPLRYRVILSTEPWKPGTGPSLSRTGLERDPGLSA